MKTIKTLNMFESPTSIEYLCIPNIWCINRQWELVYAFILTCMDLRAIGLSLVGTGYSE